MDNHVLTTVPGLCGCAFLISSIVLVRSVRGSSGVMFNGNPALVNKMRLEVQHARPRSEVSVMLVVLTGKVRPAHF